VKPRALVSLVVATSFLVVAATGVATFLLAYGERLAAVHTIAGFAFLAVALAHIANNARPLGAYARVKGRRWPSPALAIALGVAAIVVGGTLAHRGPLWSLVSWGKAHRDALAADGAPRRVYDVLRLPGTAGGHPIAIEVTKGPAYLQRTHGLEIIPQMAIWTEDLHGHFRSTLYVTQDEAKGVYVEDEQDGKPVYGRRPAALPVWAFASGARAPGAAAADPAQAIAPDAITSATPEHDFVIETSAAPIAPDADGFVVRAELNSSFDYNDYYSESAFPDDPAYHDGGNPAQPSLVYTATVRPGDRVAVMKPIGHGTVGGHDGAIDPDLSHLTTALHQVDRMIVELD
jgi:hypothetical protein